MNYVWSFEGIKVGSITMNRWEGQQMWTSGFATLSRPHWGDSEVIQWEACALQGGWYIVVTRVTGKVGEYQGATFNLPLEVAAAIRRLA